MTSPDQKTLRNRLREFAVGFLKNTIFLWLIIAVGSLGVKIAYSLLVSPLIMLSQTIFGKGNWINGLLTSVIIILAASLGLTLISAERFISEKFKELKIIGVDLKIIKLFKLLNQIRKGGMQFPEVSFINHESGDYPAGVIMGREKGLIPGEEEAVTLYNVWEPRPLSVAGKLHRLKEGAFRRTGKTGWNAVVRAWTFGSIGG